MGPRSVCDGEDDPYLRRLRKRDWGEKGSMKSRTVLINFIEKVSAHNKLTLMYGGAVQFGYTIYEYSEHIYEWCKH